MCIFKRRYSLLAAVLLASVALVDLSSGVSAAECKPGGVLTMARDVEPSSLVPWDSANNGAIFMQEQIYDHLVELMPGEGDPQPGLAKSWDVTPDGLAYVFHLREAKFSDGSPLTAEDVKFSFDRMMDTSIQAGWSFLLTRIKSFDIIDQSTIRMNMKQVDASVLYTLTLPAGGIISKKAFEAMGQQAFEEHPVGSGPFMVKQWSRGQNLEIGRNPYYWRQNEPHLDGVNFLNIPDVNARILKFESGEADVMQYVPYAQAASVGAAPHSKVLVEPYTVMYAVWLNNLIKPLDEKIVRQALNYATPKEVINQVVFAGLGTIQNSIISAGRYWDKTVTPYTYDIDKAKALLAKSSVPNGFELPILVFSSDVVSLQTAQILQAEWAKIGVKVDIRPGDRSSNSAKFHSMDYSAYMFNPTDISSDIPDDSEQAGTTLSYSDEWKGFFSGYNSKQAGELVSAAISTLDTSERAKMYAQLQRVAMEDAPSIPMIFPPTVTGVHDNLINFQTLPSGWWRLEQVCFAQ